MVFFFQRIYVFIGLAHLFLESFVIFFFRPVVTGAVLYPFEIGANYAPYVAHDIRQDFDAFFFEISICFFGGRPVCSFQDERCLYFLHGLFVQLVFHGCHENDICLLGKEFRIRNHFCPFFGVTFEGTTVAVCIFVHGFDIKACFFVPGSIDISDGGNFYPFLVHEEGTDRAYIAEALDDHGQIFHFFMALFAPGFQGEHETTAGGFISAERSAGGKRFAGHYARLPAAGKGCIFISNPCHDLAVRIDIRCRYILVRSDDWINFTHITAGESFQFSLGQFVRIHADAPFSPAVGNISNGIFNRHPCSQCFDFIFIALRMETDAALGCAAGCGMLHAVTGEDFHMTIIHTDRNAHSEFPFRITDEFIVLFLITQYCCCFIQHVKHVFVRIVICHFYAS